MNEKLSPLNGLKGMGSLIIAYFFHYNHFVPAQKHPLYFIRGLDKLCIYGWMTVGVFFFLSGITFMSLYSDRIRKREISGEKFALLRFSRLWPVHILTLGIITLVQGVRVVAELESFKFISNDLYNFVLNVFMLHAIGVENGAGYNWVSWTVSINVLLYFLFWQVCRKTKDDNGIFVLSICLDLFGIYIIKNGGFLLFSSNVGRGIVAFFWGVLVVIIYRTLEKLLNKKKRIYVTLICFTGCFAISKVIGTDCSTNSGVLEVTYIVTYMTSIIFFVWNITWLNKLLSSKLLKWLGNISFSLFMIHYPIQVVLVTINEKFLLGWDYSRLSFWIAYVFISMSVSYLCYEYIEKKASREIRDKYNTLLLVEGKIR